MLSEQDRAWWTRRDVDATDVSAHERLLRVLKEIERAQSWRKRQMLLCGSLYGDWTGTSDQVDSYNSRGPGKSSILGLNISRSVVDAVTSRIFAKVPKLAYVTQGGDYQRQHNAEQLERGVEGVLDQCDGDEVATEFGKRGAIYGTSFVRCEPDWDREDVSLALWQPWERIFDDGEAVYGQGKDSRERPRCEYTHRYWDKYVLIHWVKEHLEKMGGDPDRVSAICDKLDRMGGEKDDDAELGYQQSALRLAVYEGLHRPSGREAEDGRLVMCVNNATIIDTLTDLDELPFATYRWSRPVMGFYGQGLIEQGKGIQSEVNKLVRMIQTGHHLITGKWLCHTDAKVIAAHINNDLSTILKWSGAVEPKYYAPSIISPETYQHLWNLCARYYQLASVNEQAAEAKVPAGMESGEAQRQYSEHQDAALLQRGKGFERAWRDVGSRVSQAAKQLADEAVYEVRSHRDGDEGYETIDWAKLDDVDGYRLVEMPASQLPGTMAGRISTAKDMQALGVADNDDLVEIVGMPDTLKLTRRKLAWRKRVAHDVSLMLREGEPRIPDVFLGNFTGALAYVLEEYNEACTREDADEDRLQLLRDYATKLQELMPKAPPPTPQAMVGGGLAAPGAVAPVLPHPGGAPPGPGAGPPPQAPPVAA